MSSIMYGEYQEKILDLLNQRGLPFSRYSFLKDKTGLHMERLGSGGGGAVYTVKSRLGDQRAVKIIGFQLPPISDLNLIHACEEEIQTQREVGKNCREIVQIEDAQVLCIKLDEDCNVIDAKELTSSPPEEGYGLFLFILMEKLQPVHSAMKGIIPRLASLEEHEVIKFAMDIAKALRAAHTHPQKIIHRDVKPDNIFWDELTGVYKLGDFGIAKATQNTKSMTQGSGTGDYRAPEVRGSRTYDTRADIYSYGILLFNLLNRDWACRRLYDEDLPLPEPDNGSAALKKIVMRACAYDPDDRYASINDLIQDLEQLQAHPAVATPAKQNAVDAPAPEAAEAASRPLEHIQLTDSGKADHQPTPSKAERSSIALTEGNHAAESSRSDDAFSAMRKGKVEKEQPAAKAAATAKATPPAKATASQTHSDDPFFTMRKGNPRPATPNPKTAEKQRRRYLVACAFGFIGLAALLLVLLSAEVIWKDSFLPNLSAWQTYVAIALSMLCSVIAFSLKYDFYIPVLTPLFSFIENKPLWTLAWLTAIGFNLYCFFGLGFNWIFLVIAVSLLVGSKGLMLVTNLGALASIPLAIFQAGLPSIPAAYYWVMIALFVLGIRYTIILMNGFIPEADIELAALWRTRKEHFIVTIIFVAIGGIIFILDLIPAINIPVAISQLHLFRAAVVCFVISVIEDCFDELL